MNSEELYRQFVDSFTFLKIFRVFRMAIQPSKLIIAFAALLAVCAAGWVMDFTRTVVATPGTNGQTTELNMYVRSPEQVQSYIERFRERGEHRGVFETVWGFGSDRFHGAITALFSFELPVVAGNIADCFKAAQWALRYHFIYCVIFAAIALVVTAVAGGAICRIAALQCARDEKPGMGEALRFSIKRFSSFFTAPLVPVVIVVIIGIAVGIVGLIGNIPRLGELVVGLSTPALLAAGALMALALIGTIAGFNLMYPAVAYDGTDSFDAVSRAFNYIYARPWRTGFYSVVAAVYGAICYTFVRLFAFALLWTTHWALRLAVWAGSTNGQGDKVSVIWAEPSFMRLHAYPTSALNWSESASAFLIYVSVLIVVGLLVSFIMSFYFSAGTVIYALLRNKVDGAEISDVYAEQEQPGKEPAVPQQESKPDSPDTA